MNEKEVTVSQQLQADCQAFIAWIDGFSDEQFRNQVASKWSVADVMQHLYLSARPVVRLMTGPREVLSQWGPVNAPSRAYNDIVVAYQTVLGTGAKAPAALSPRPEDVQVTKDEMIARFAEVYNALAVVLDRWSASELDEYYIPHPALGKLTVREMLYFTSIHTQHHLRLLKPVQN